MGKPAARITDMHMCPMVTPGLPPVPHVGGPVTGPGVPTVLIGKMPAAVMGDMCTCVGPPDTIIMGSTGVLIGGKPAARMGDPTAHGGMIAAGLPNVLIGEVSPGGVNTGVVAPSVLALQKPLKDISKIVPVKLKAGVSQTVRLKQAAITGSPLVEKCNNCGS